MKLTRTAMIADMYCGNRLDSQLLMVYFFAAMRCGCQQMGERAHTVSSILVYHYPGTQPV